MFLFSGLEYNKQQYNPSASTDFLQHEGGVYGQKNDHLASQYTNTQAQTSQNTNSGKRDYVAQFPSLRPPTTANTAGTTVNKPNSGRRDYVAAQFPILPSPTTPKPSTTVTSSTRNTQSSNGKRDYVAPQHTTPKPNVSNHPSTGKVKDLVNFYDRQNNGQTTPQRVPSYSSILQGSTNRNTQGSTSTTVTQTTPKTPSSPTKPVSFSDILSGSKSPSTQLTTPRPSTRFPVNNPTTRPVLPSSILNQNTPAAVSSGPATDLELKTLSEELLRKDVNNAAKFVTVNYQEKTTSQSTEDKAPSP